MNIDLPNDSVPTIPETISPCPECNRAPSAGLRYVLETSPDGRPEIVEVRCPHPCHTDHDRTESAWTQIQQANELLKKEIAAVREYSKYCASGTRASYGEGFVAGYAEGFKQSGVTSDTLWADSVANAEIERMAAAREKHEQEQEQELQNQRSPAA